MRVLIVTLIMCLFAISTQAQYSGGSGTAKDPYQIATTADLIALGETPDDYDKHFILTADIDLDPNLRTRKLFDRAVIGPYGGSVFTGIFDGNNHRLSHLTIEGVDHLGLFGEVGSDAEVRNLEIVDLNVVGSGSFVGGVIGCNAGHVVQCRSAGIVSGDRDVGGLVGHNLSGHIESSDSTCRISGSRTLGGLAGSNDGIISSSHSAGSVGQYYANTNGGLVGFNSGHIESCSSTGSVGGNEEIGGLVGKNEGTIRCCQSTSEVSAEEDGGGLVGWNGGTITSNFCAGAVDGDRYIGGLVGRNFGVISSSYSIDTASGNSWVGGLVGSNTMDGSISFCYSTGVVISSYRPGGLVGSCGNTSSIVASFWDTQTSGLTESDGGTGLTTAQMQDINTYLDVGWDFINEAANGIENIWKISDGLDYPRLWWERYGGGTGEPNDPYLIYTADHLNALGAEPNDYDKHFKLMANIDLSGYEYDRAVIAADMIPDNWGFTRSRERQWIFDGIPFTGVFDGNGHTISHLRITGVSWLGLFGWLGSEAEVTDLGAEAVDVNGVGDAIGGLVGGSNGSIISAYSTGLVRGTGRGIGGLDRGTGREVGGLDTGTGRGIGGLVGVSYAGYEGLPEGGTIMASHSTATVMGGQAVGGLVGANGGPLDMSYSTGEVYGEDYVGGLVGQNYYGSVTTSYSAGAVHGEDSVGGLVGETFYGRIAMSCSTGPVSGGNAVGGLVGRNGGYCRITDSFSRGTVTADDWVGGLVGRNDGGIITVSYSTGTVTARIGRHGVGGLVGDNDGSVTKSFWDMETSGQAEGGGGTGLTTAEMQTASTFLEAGWDFIGETESGTDDIWWIDEGQDYPRLWWELATAERLSYRQE